MNKLVPTIILALIASIIALWYVANRPPSPRNLHNILVVGTNAEYKPFSFMQDDVISGFDIDVIHEVAKRIGKTVQLHDMPFDSLIPALQTGAVQVIAAGISPTPERAQRVLFTKPYLSGDQLVIVSLAHKPIENLDQLRDAKAMNVGVNEGFTADYYVSDYFNKEINPPNLIRFATAIELFMALESGRIEALVAAQNTIKGFIKHQENKFHVAPIPNTGDEYALAISKKNPELVPLIQQALDQMMQDGFIDELKKKWKLD